MPKQGNTVQGNTKDNFVKNRLEHTESTHLICQTAKALHSFQLNFRMHCICDPPLTSESR